MKAIMGGGYDQQIAQNFIHSGTQGYREMEESMRRQADAATKLQEIQGTLGMTFENTMSIFNNVEIDWVRTFADDLKSLLREGVQPFLLGVQDWISNNRELARSREQLETTVKAAGADKAKVEEAANAAKAGCPISKVLKLDIELSLNVVT